MDFIQGKLEIFSVLSRESQLLICDNSNDLRFAASVAQRCSPAVTPPYTPLIVLRPSQ